MQTHKIRFQMQGKESNIFCYLEVEGELTHEDYELFVPAFEESIKNLKEPRIKLFVNITKLQGWDLESVWDDLKFGLNHEKEFVKIAVLGKSSFFEYGVKLSNWLVASQMKYFEDFDEAKEWLLDE